MLALLLNAGQADAARWYQIELLLFSNESGLAKSSESWDTDPGAPDPTGSLLLQRPGNALVAVSSGERHLNGERRQLERSGRYRTLLHLAWRQPIPRGGKGKKLYFQLPRPGSGFSIADLATGFGPAPRLQGTLTVTRGRYLHADLDVLYRKPPSARRGETGDTTEQTYRLRENRRMRSADLHYLDHPALGALIIAHRYHTQSEAEEPETGNESDEQHPAPPAPASAKPIEPN